MKNKQKVLTTGEAARYCGVNFRTIIRWIEKGYLEAYKLPGRGDNRIPAASLIAFLSKNNMPIPEELAPVNKRVLIVEDQAEMASAISRTLKRNGYETKIAKNGFEAGDKLNSFDPFLMTLDIQMPGLSGLDVLAFTQSEARFQNLKIIVISAKNQDQLDLALQMGANAVLSKPFKNELLISTVESLEINNL